MVYKLKNGDEKVFEEVFYLYKDKLYSFCFRMLASDDLSKEVIQETMVRLWERRASIDSERSLNGYIYAIARNLVRDHVMKYAREAELTITDEKADQHTALDELNVQEIIRMEQEAVSKLPPQQRTVYQLSRHEQLSHAEIADNMGISVNSVKTHLRLALKTLKEHLSPITHLISIIITVLLKG